MHPPPLPQSPHRQTKDTHSVPLLSQVPLTPEQFALVSGKNGATARQIADESGAKLELNKYVFLPSNPCLQTSHPPCAPSFRPSAVLYSPWECIFSGM